jgi:hypothetical protein
MDRGCVEDQPQRETTRTLSGLFVRKSLIPRCGWALP